MKNTVSLLQLTDLHILENPKSTLLGVNTEHYFHAVLTHALHEQKEKYDALLLTGDLTQEPCKESYQRIFKYVENYGLRTICLAGNHDNFKLMKRVFNTEQINCQKQFFIQNWQIISLNSQISGSEAGRFALEELQFLKHCLDAEPNKYTFIAFHHHCVPSESNWLDTMQIENSAEFLALISAYPQIKAITTGHIHQKLDKKVGEVFIWGTPSTCFQFKPLSYNFALDKTPPGYRIIELNDDGTVASRVVRLATDLNELQIDTAGY